MQLRLGGELGQMVEEEAQKQGMSGALLVKIIVGQWMSENYKKRMKGKKKLQNQSAGASGDGNATEKQDEQPEETTVTAHVIPTGVK